MSFGRNPHVSKAEDAEQKAEDAVDTIARVQARRDAARQWDRAAEREKPGKMRTAYEANAERNRRIADGGGSDADDAEPEPTAPVLVAEQPEGRPEIQLDPAQLN